MSNTRFLLSLLLLGCICSPATYASSTSQDQLKALKVIRKYNVFLNTGNGHLLSALDACLTAKIQNNKAPNFLMKLNSVLGDEISEEYTCRALLSRYFGFKDEEPFMFRKAFRSMQYHAILAQSGTGQLEDTESLDGQFLEKFKSFEHPARGTLDLVMNQTVYMPKPEKIVWEKAFQDYQKLTVDHCRSFVTEKAKLINFRLKKFSGKPFTQNLCSVLLRKNNPSLTWQESWEVGIVRNSFTTYSRNKRKAWSKDHLEKYYDVIATHPHFLLLEGRVLNLQQMKKVVARMMTYQKKGLARLQQMTGTELLSLTPFLDQAEMTLRSMIVQETRWSEGHADTVIGDLRKSYAQAESRKMKIQIGGLVGAMVACQLLPFGRAKLFVRNICMFALGLPLDIYFITDATLQRIKTVQAFTSTPEAEYFMLKPDAISEANRAIIMELIFMPLDIPAQGTLNAAKKLIRRRL
jgi:uncharacterized membrane protein